MTSTRPHVWAGALVTAVVTSRAELQLGTMTETSSATETSSTDPWRGDGGVSFNR